MIDIEHVQIAWVRPTLKHLDIWSIPAEQLVLGTGLVESHYTYMYQHGNGPARGFWQMEPKTHDDIWQNWLKYKKDIGLAIKGLRFEDDYNFPPNSDMLVNNPIYACAMCRVHYRRVKEALPQENDVVGLARYWKKYYNTFLGAGKPEEFTMLYNKYVNPLY